MLDHQSARVANGLARRSVAFALCLFAAGACARRTSSADPGVTAIRSGGSTISVVNRQWMDLRIYVTTRTGDGYRLGLVPRLGSGTFALPAQIHLPAQLTFMAVPLGIDDPQIVGPIEVAFGSRLLFTLDPKASGPTVVKRP
jgi:hypothetical protein